MSKLWTVSTRQWIKGLIIAVLPVIVIAVKNMVDGQAEIDVLSISKTSLSAALTYILASISQDEHGKFGGKL